MNALAFVLLLLTLFAGSVRGQTLKALFDNTKNETAGNADWIIDTDQPVPVPAQSGITPATPQSYWLGAISAWGVDLVKRGFTVHTLTTAYGISYGDGTNPYDLSNYNLFVVCEPQNPFSPSEKAAILAYVQNGGGLMMVADHNGSDRDNDGWDSPEVWNDLGTATYFGIHFQSTGDANNNISQVSTEVSTAPDDSVIHGGDGAAIALSYHNGTTMTLLTANNPTAAGHIWMNGAAHGATQVMAATAHYGAGKVAGVGDSSPADDGSAQPGNSNIFNGWGEVGATDSIVFLNMSLWLTQRSVASPPAQVALISPADSSVENSIPTAFRWALVPGALSYELQVSISNTFSTTVMDDSGITDTSNSASTLLQGALYYWRVRAGNGAGWGSFSDVWRFTTWSTPPAVLLDAPADSSVDVPTPVSLLWHPAPGGTTYGLQMSDTASFTRQIVNDSLLVDTSASPGVGDPGARYYWRVRSKNAAGWGAYSSTSSFSTWRLPAQVILLQPADGAAGLSAPVSFAWQGVTGALAYELEVADNPSFGSGIRIDTLLSDTSCASSGLDTLTVYYWRVRGRAPAGRGPFSGNRTFHLFSNQIVTETFGEGWNLVSVPLAVAESSRAALFPGSTGSAFAFGIGYEPADTLRPGLGYWIKFDSVSQVSLVGVPRTNDTIALRSGWNLIGALSRPIASGTISSNPPGTLSSPFYKYDSLYLTADSLLPFRGYWIKASQAGTIVLH